jgi:phospholipid/cholesterol/gamma-HCH transport system substrate-binding protein
LKFALSKEVKVALLAIVTGAMLYTGFNVLKGKDTFSKTHEYIVLYKNVDGLTTGNPIFVNGMNVGQVKDLSLNGVNGVSVLVQVNKAVEMTDSTIARLTDASLLGGKAIMLELKAGTRILNDGDTIDAGVQPKLAEMLATTATPLINSMDKTLGNVNSILGNENQKKIGAILANFEALSLGGKEILDVNKRSLAVTMDNLNKISGSLIETEKQLKPILANLNALSDSLKDTRLKATVEQANKAVGNLNNTLNSINQGQGTLGKLVKDDSVYTHLDKAVKDLDLLLLDMKARPGRYIHFSVFGKKDKP